MKMQRALSSLPPIMQMQMTQLTIPNEPMHQWSLSLYHVHAFHTIWPTYLLAYMQPYPL